MLRWSPWRRRDHPRSRGVYIDNQFKDNTDDGSSPLARGLLAEYLHDPVIGRIIPARAGFTGCCSWVGRWPGDHPRSRGVYAGLDAKTEDIEGSSPLARGLHSPPQNRETVDGIIPARAGFTLADP